MYVTSYNPDGGAFAFFIAMGFFFFLFAVAFYVLSSFFLMKIFDKAGVQGRWRAWVPIYNFMVFAKLGDLNPWLVLISAAAAAFLGWIPVIGQIIALLPLVVTLAAAWRVGLKLQKDVPWVILYFFLSIVWLGINAFDKSQWNPNVPPAPWAGNSFLSDTTQWAGIPRQASAGGFAPPAAASAPSYGAPSAPYGAPPAGGGPAPYTPPPAPPATTAPPAAAPTTPPPAATPSAPPASAPAAAPSDPGAPGAPEPPAPPTGPGTPEPPASPDRPQP